MTQKTPGPAWQRGGLVLSVEPRHPWWVSHAQIPTVLALSNRLWRVYFGARDNENRSRILAVDLDPGEGMRVVADHFEPLLDLGEAGSFDEAGMAPSTVIRVGGEIRLYYTALFLRRDVPGQATIGLAVSEDGLRFRKAVAGPVHGLGPYDPFFTSVPHVIQTADGFRMWYVAGIGWRLVNGELMLVNEIRTTRSLDGVIWDPRSERAVGPWSPDIVGLGRPWLVETKEGRRLLVSRRGETHREPGNEAYRLVSIAADREGSFSGAEEPVLFTNSPASGDFDSWMQCYACVVPKGRDFVMFYNGNDFGRDGFGWASLPDAALSEEAAPA